MAVERCALVMFNNCWLPTAVLFSAIPAQQEAGHSD
jgi:hypothetical protein